mgnify:FL=1
MKHLFPALLIALVSLSCVNTKSVMLDLTAVKRPEVPPDSVRILVDESELDGLDFIRVAMIEASGASGWTSQSGMVKAMRKKAGKLGANAILMPTINEPGAGAKIAAGLFNTVAERKGNVIAIFIVGPKKE